MRLKVIRTFLTDDGLLDAFILGDDGRPIARLEHPVRTGDEVHAFAHEFFKQLEAQEAETEQEETEDDLEQVPDLGPLDKFRDALRRLRGRSHARAAVHPND